MDFVGYTDDGYDYLEGIELMSVGMEWPASNMDYTCTFEHLADIVLAANDDPMVQDPRNKIGHESEVNGVLRTVNPFEELGDAAPALGRYVNLRLVNDGAVLLGDLVEVPVWLADAMPSAYPNRSSEPWLSVDTPNGKHYSAVLTAVSLLGEALPAIKDLEDLQRLMDGGPAAVAATEREESATVPDTTAELSVSTGVIRERFNWDWVTDPESVEGVDTYWWWARDIRVDPSEVIADDDEGNLWQIPFETDGEDTVTFGEPQKVREVYVPVAAKSGDDNDLRRMAPIKAGQRVLAADLDRPKKTDPATAAEAAESEESMSETTMTLTPEQVKRVRDLGEDATQEEIDAAIAGEGAEASETTETETVETAETETETEAVAATTDLSDGMVAVPADQWAEVQAGAKQGTELAKASETKRRDDTIAAATKVGKIKPAQADSMVNLHGSNPEAFYTLLTAAVDKGGLAEGLVPVTEVGSSAEVTASTDAEHEAFMKAHYPQAARQRNGAGVRQEA